MDIGRKLIVNNKFIKLQMLRQGKLTPTRMKMIYEETLIKNRK